MRISPTNTNNRLPKQEFNGETDGWPQGLSQTKGIQISEDMARNAGICLRLGFTRNLLQFSARKWCQTMGFSRVSSFFAGWTWLNPALTHPLLVYEYSMYCFCRCRVPGAGCRLPRAACRVPGCRLPVVQKCILCGLHIINSNPFDPWWTLVFNSHVSPSKTRWRHRPGRLGVFAQRQSHGTRQVVIVLGSGKVPKNGWCIMEIPIKTERFGGTPMT